MMAHARHPRKIMQEDNMNQLSYEYFLLASKELNFTRAAQKLFISQQSLSQHIAKLEKHYGVELFTRTNPLSLTYAGQRMVSTAEKILDLEVQSHSEMQDIAKETRGELNIGMTARREQNFLPMVLCEFFQEYPNICVNCLDGSTRELEQFLADGTVDLILTTSPSSRTEFESIPLMEDRTLLIISESMLRKCCADNFNTIIEHRLERLPLSLFANCPFLLAPSGYRVRRMLDEAFIRSGITPHVQLTSGNTSTL
jgi:DNA-binding transcriptional LysR family regulator